MKIAIGICVAMVSLLSLAHSDDFSEAARHYQYDPKAPLNVREINTEHRSGIVVHDITYNGAKGAVPAYLVVPEGKGPFAAILWGHWMVDGSPLKNRKEFLQEAIVLAHSGVVSLLIDSPMVRPGYKERNQPDDIQQDVIDLRRGLDLLVARQDVDKTRLAYVGHSFHAGTGAILAGLDKRPKAFVLMAGAFDFSQYLVSDAPVFVKLREKTPVETLRQVFAQYSWANACQFVSRAAPAAVLLQDGTHDEFMTVKDIEHYNQCVSQPKQVKMYDAGHALNGQATTDRDDWLRVQLNFKPVDQAALAKIPPLK